MREETIYFCEKCSRMFTVKKSCKHHERLCTKKSDEVFTITIVTTYQIVVDIYNMVFSKAFPSTEVYYRSSLTGKLHRKSHTKILEVLNDGLPDKDAGMGSICITRPDGKFRLSVSVDSDKITEEAAYTVLLDYLRGWTNSFAANLRNNTFTEKI